MIDIGTMPNGMLNEDVFADMVVSKKDFNEIAADYLDFTDRATLETVTSINEADRAAVLTSLTSKLYDNIVDKVYDIDFGSVPASKGDITKIDNYDKLIDCTELMGQIVSEYKQDMDPINVVKEAISNIESRTKLWQKSYQMNLQLPIVTYQTMVMACVSSISLLVASCIEFIKSTGDDTYTIVLNRVAYTRSSQNLLYDNLKKFNTMCKSGELDNMINHVIATNTKQFAGGVATAMGAGLAVVLLIRALIPMLRELVYFFFHAKQSISDYFAIQADLLEVNAANLQYRTDISKDERDTIYTKQTNIAGKFRNVSNKFQINMTKGQKGSAAQIASEKRKFKMDDITDGKLDSDDAYGLF